MTVRSYRALGVASGVALLVSFALLAYSRLELATVRHNVQRAHDIAWLLECDRDRALQATVPQAVEILWFKLYSPALMEQPKHGDFDAFIDRQRGRAIRDVILYLRTKTGDDLGSDPEAWIEKYGDDDTKESFTSLKEALSDTNMPEASNQSVETPMRVVNSRVDVPTGRFH